jgi:flagellar motor protein MotB
MVKAGTCTLSTAQSGNTKYLSATPVTRSFEISLADQAALSLTSTTATFGANFTLTTSGGSGTGDVTYIKVSGDCTVAGTTLTPTAAGSCDVTATKAADTQYASATITQTVTISRANQSTSLTLSETTVIYGQTLTLSAGGGDGAGAISYAVSSGTCSLSGATLTPGDAGSVCEVEITRALSSNYNAQTSNPISITIQRATPTLGSLTLARKTFGDAPFTLTAPSADYNSAAVAGTWTYISAQASVATINASTATVTGGGTSVLTATFTPDDSTNFVTTSTTSTLTVDKATPTFSWTNVSATYGDADISIVSPTVATTSATGTWTYFSADTSVVAIAGTKFDVLNAGTSVVTATFTPSNTTNFVTGGAITMTVTVDTANQVALVISSVTGTYGTDLTLTTTGGSTNGTITWGASNGTATGCAITSGKLTTTSAGNCEVTATMAGNSNYNPVNNPGTTVTINAKPITVTAEPKLKTYGDNDPALTFTTDVGALVGNDTLTGSLTRVAGNTVGEYTINQGTVTNSNYTITYASAKLTINAKPITVTATAKFKTYGDTDPALTYTTAVGDLVGSDTLSGSLTRTASETVGEYTINQGTVTNANNTNYDIAYTTAKLTIHAKPITVTAEAKIKTYGDNDPTLTFTTAIGALVGNDTLSGALTRVAGNTVGEYTINQGTVTNSNYTITYASAKLTINAKPITVTAEAKTKIFGDDDPALTFTTAVGALVGNDTFTGSLTRAAGEQVASYPITIGTLNNTNYLITFVDSVLAITPAPQSQLTVTTTSITYQTPVLLQATGGTEGSLSFAVVSPGTAGCSINNGSLIATGNAGSTCTVAAARAATTNYQQKMSSATTITVAQRLITVTATAEEKTYGDADPGFRYSVTAGSLHGSDSFTGSLGRTAGENVGTYDIDQGTLANANYSITFVPAQLTVNRRPITVTALNKTKIFGQSDPALTYSVTTGNIVNSDALTGSITRAVGETLGNYNITRGTLANGNYTITFVVGTFQITGAQQTGFSLTASSFSVVYQQTVTLSTTGGDGAGAVTYTTQNGSGSCSLAGSTLTGSTAGTCTVTATKAAEGGYLAATSNTITVTVDKADQVIAFAQIANRDFSPSPVVVGPTSTSGAQVVLDSRTPNVCFTEDLEIRMTDSGTCSIEAEVPESRNHNAAQTVVRSFEVRAVVPFAPTISSVEPGDAKVTIAFTPGLSGGAPITTYRYSVDDGTRWVELPNGTTSSPIVVGNLPNNVEARVRIMAVNRVGAGARSNMKVTTPVTPRSFEWETQRSLISSALPSSQPTVASLSNQLPPRPATVKIQSLQGGRRTQVTAVRAARDANIPVTHAIISVRTRTNKLLARIKVLVNPANPTTSVSVPYASSKVRVTVQFANDIGISDGGTAGVNIAEGNTFEWTTVSNESRIKGTQIKGDLFFARGKSTLTYTMQQTLKRMAATAKARGGLIYVSGFAQKGELKSAWMLEPLARARAETVSKYLAKIGVRQWITFHGTSNSAFNGWEPVSGRQVIITTVMPDET